MMAEQEQFQKRSARYFKIGVVFLYSFALLHSLDPFFVWVPIGGTLGCFVWALYYRWLSNPKAESSPTEFSAHRRQSVGAPTAINKTSITKNLKFVPFILGTVMAIAVIAVIFSSGNKVAEDNGEELSSEPNASSNSIDPNTAEGILERGNTLFNSSQFDSAMVYYNRALALQPGYKEAYYNIALIYSSKSDFQNAIATLEECLKKNPDYGDGMQLMGNCYYQQQQQGEALKFYERAYATGTRNAELSHYMAYLYDVQNNTQKAIQFYREAIEQDSSKIDVYKRLAELEPNKAAWYTKKTAQWSGN